MKTVVSLPSGLFKKAESLAKRTKKSRSKLYQEAIAEYVERHSLGSITGAIDKVLDEVPNGPDPFVQGAAERILRRIGWEA